MKAFIKKIISIGALLLLILTFSFIRPAGQIYAGLISTSSVQLSDSRPGQSGTTYTAVFTPSGSGTVKCINIAFAANPDMTGGVPSGPMTTTSAVKGTISGGGLTDANWSLVATTNGTLSYQYATGAVPTATVVTIPTTTITNPTATTFYAQITTYNTIGSPCTGQVDQSYVIALATLGGVTASVTIQPTLTFSLANYGSAVNTSGDTGPVTTTTTTIPFSTVAAGATAWGSQLLTVSTNGVHGYTLYVRDTQALTDTTADTIHDQSGTPSSGNSFDYIAASQSSFAYTADGNGYTFGGSNKWAGLTQSNVAIANRTAAINTDPTHIEFKVGISNVQPAGTYSTVIAYTATPSY